MKNMKVEKELQKYLNKLLRYTDSYLTVLALSEMNPEEILEVEDKKLKSLASLIYLCRDMLTYVPHEINYTGTKFKVKLINTAF